MSVFCTIVNGKPDRTGLRSNQLVHPRVSIPENPHPEDLTGTGFAIWETTPQPTPGPGQIAVLGEPVKIQANVWKQTWVLRAPTPAEVEAARPPVPQVVSRFQARAALLAAGHLDTVIALVNQADAFTQLAWNEAVEVRRTSPMIATIGAALGLTSDQIDDLFREAIGIEA